MARGGRTKATWAKGQKPPVKRPKGSRNKRTIIKEKLGLENWEGFEFFVQKQGATKLINEMNKLKGRNYVMAYQSLIEFVKPKLARSEHTGGDGKPLFPDLDIKKLSSKELEQLVKLKEKMTK